MCLKIFGFRETILASELDRTIGYDWNGKRIRKSEHGIEELGQKRGKAMVDMNKATLNRKEWRSLAETDPTP